MGVIGMKAKTAWVLGMILVGIPTVSGSENISERYWISRETLSTGVDNCRDGKCPQEKQYTTRLFAPESKTQLRRLMSLLDFQAAANGMPVEHPERPEFCAQQMPDPNTVIWNPEWMKTSHKLEALRGLEAIHVDVSGLKAPTGFNGPFGTALQKEVEAKFAAAGIPIVSKEEIERVPGQPKLQVFFSATNPDSGCWWSVFATMTQTALLTRDISVKISAGTWAHMRGFDPDDLELTEYGAISGVFDAFVDDYKEANAEDFEPVNVLPYTDLFERPMTVPQVSVKSYAQILEEAPLDPDTGEPVEVAEPEFLPSAMKPEPSPKALKRMQAAHGQTPTADDVAPDALEKLSTTGIEATNVVSKTDQSP